jgi:dihydroxyacetone kinase
MRKIINDPQNFVAEVMEGIFAAHGDAIRPATADNRTLVRTDAPAPGRVGIVTGGGSGHLPFFLGYVGRGLCSAVAIGNVFSSPSSGQIYAASRTVHSDAGLLYLYGNYGGDIYNFDLAADKCRADGIEVATVLGTDDILSAPKNKASTRRGVAGLVLVYKVAGAAAEQLLPLNEVTRIAQKAADRTRTIGVGLSPTILPAAGEATFSLNEDEMEIGIGIHGERGAHRGRLETADQITDRFLTEIGQELELTKGQRVAVLVNGLGSTPLEELYVVYRRVNSVLTERGVVISHCYVGEFVTSLEMAGASISIMVTDAELERLLDAPAESPFFKQGAIEAKTRPLPSASSNVQFSYPSSQQISRTGTPSRLREKLILALPRMQAHIEELRELDAILGDGDLGITVGRGSQAILEALHALPADADAPSVIRATAAAFSAANPSTFAALLGGGLYGGGEVLEEGQDLDALNIQKFLQAVFDRIAARGGAALGDKTMLDILQPVIDSLEQSNEEADGLECALAAARRAVEDTARLRSAKGRAAWQSERSIGQRDPGGVAILRFIEAL